MTKKLSERDEAIVLANKVLEDASLDPDGDLSMMSRQFLRARETIERQEKALQEVDWQGKATEDLVNANRDQMLKMHEEAVRRIRKIVGKHTERLVEGDENSEAYKVTLHFTAIGALDCKMIYKILDAINMFHLMYEWRGWPEGSE